MRKTLITLACFTLAIFATAVPAKRTKKVITLPDGTTTEVVLRGDEHHHYYQSIDGRRFEQLADASFRSISEASFIEASERAKARRGSIMMQQAKRIRRTRSMANEGHEGKKKGIVILVNFTDTKMQEGSTQSVFSSMMNQVGYNQNGHIGSVHDYFLDQSHGKLDVTFDVVGPYTLAHNMKYYGENDMYGDDIAPATMVIEACKLANADVNYADYDWNGDGEVDQVYVIYAGYSEAQGASVNTIWPHEWLLDEAKTYGDGTGTLTLDGMKINTYACSSELNGTSGSRIDGIGTTCHEFSHCLGLPDLYDTVTEDGENFGMDAWSLMDYGSYNADGYIPAAYTAYERMYAGWHTPQELNESATISGMKPITSGDPTGYIIYNKANENEYYILQNIQQESWNKAAYGHGLLIMHVDYSKRIWEENTVNNVSSHQRCTVVHADNSAGIHSNTRDMAGDPFPGLKNVTELSDYSTPAATLYNANTDGSFRLHAPITDIKEQNGLISFLFKGGATSKASTPVATEATRVGDTFFTANWNPAEGASSYNLKVTLTSANASDPEKCRILSEDFSGFADVTTDGSADISSTLDGRMQTRGWSGTKVFAAPNSVKVGSSKSQGFLSTPEFTPQSGAVTLFVKAKAYNDEDANLTIVLGKQQKNITMDGTLQHVTFTDVLASSTSISMMPAKRAYISLVELYDGIPGDAAAETLTFSNITANHYTVSDLPADIKTCSYMVQSVDNAGTPTAWSNSINVVMAPEGIQLNTIPKQFPTTLFDLQGRTHSHPVAPHTIRIESGRKTIQ